MGTSDRFLGRLHGYRIGDASRRAIRLSNGNIWGRTPSTATTTRPFTQSTSTVAANAPQAFWSQHAGHCICGYLVSDRTQYSLAEAQQRCVELGSACGALNRSLSWNACPTWRFGCSSLRLTATLTPSCRRRRCSTKTSAFHSLARAAAQVWPLPPRARP